jgi:hypothetical protein
MTVASATGPGEDLSLGEPGRDRRNQNPGQAGKEKKTAHPTSRTGAPPVADPTGAGPYSEDNHCVIFWISASVGGASQA